jgi:hypothetical protein
MCPKCDSVFRGEMLFVEHRKTVLLSRTTSTLLHAWSQTNKAPVQIHVTKRSKCPLSSTLILKQAQTPELTSCSRSTSTLNTKATHLDVHYALRAQKESQVGDYMVRQFARYLTALRIYLRENTNLYPDMDLKSTRICRKQPEGTLLFCNQVPVTKEGEEDPELLVVHHDHNRPSPNIVGYLCRGCNRREGKVNNSFP